MGHAGPGHDQVVQREEEGTKQFTAVVTDGAKVKQPGRFWFPKSQAHCPPHKHHEVTTQVGPAHLSLGSD